MNVVHVVRRFTASKWGGVEEYVLNLVRQQREEGMNSWVFSTSALREESDNFLEKWVSYFDYKYPYLWLNRAQSLSLDNFFGNPLCFSMLKKINSMDVDVLHIHTNARFVLPLIKCVKSKKNCKVIVHEHSGVSSKIKVEKPVVSKLNGSYGKLFDLYYKKDFLYKKVDSFILNNLEDLSHYRKNYPNAKSNFLPCFVNPLFFDEVEESRDSIRSRYGFSAKDPLFLVVGRIQQLKNQLSVVKALPFYPEAKLLIVGPKVDSAYFSEILSFIKTNKLEERVYFRDPLRFDDVERIKVLKAVDFCLFPSVYDSLGIVILEAWAAKCEVISSKLPQWFKYGEGLMNFADFENPEKLAHSLRESFLQPSEIKRSRLEKAFSKVSKEFSLPTHFKEIKTLYGWRK